MNTLGTDKFSNAKREQEIIKSSDDLLEYCHVCFIALGSHEKRIYREKKVAHLDCEQKQI